MQPTQQTVIPVSLFYGVVTSSPVAVTLDPTFDHLLLPTYISNNNPNAEQLAVSDSDGNPIFSAACPGYDEFGNPGNVLVPGGLLLQGLSGLILQWAPDFGYVAMSAWRLNPSATLIFS